MEDIKQEFKVKGEELVEKIKQLLHEGNIRRIIVKGEDGKIYLEIPVTFGLVGVLLAPTIAALGAIAAMVANLKLEIVKTEETEKKKEG